MPQALPVTSFNKFADRRCADAIIGRRSANHTVLPWMVWLLLTGVTALPRLAYAQSTQTIRGRVVDGVSNSPLPGATVIVLGNDTQLTGTTTDEDGRFRINGVPLGRQ